MVRPSRAVTVVALPHWPRKEAYACCRARVDELGRYPVGWCSPTCERRALVNTAAATNAVRLGVDIGEGGVAQTNAALAAGTPTKEAPRHAD